MKETQEPEHRVPGRDVERALKLSYCQAILGTIYGASVGGQFLIGCALKLGADNVQIGLLSTVPAYMGAWVLLSSALVERGASRRRLTILGTMLASVGWAGVAVLSALGPQLGESIRIGLLIGIVTVISALGSVAGNARASWIGDLIPPRRLGEFFGKLYMYSSVIAAVFSIGQSRYLDYAKGMGTEGFTWLFAFGAFFGIINSALFAPQRDVPIEKHESGGRLGHMIRDTLANRPLLTVVAFGAVYSFQGFAGPFYATYVLRDLRASYLTLGLLGAASTLTGLLVAPFWGRMVDRYGCRPVMIACTAVFAPLPLAWYWVNSQALILPIILPTSALAGVCAGGVGVALSTLVYRVTPNAGRSMQFAVYSIIVMLLSAPMPTLGGCFANWLRATGWSGDVRCTFYASSFFIFASMLMALKLIEPNSRSTAEMVRELSSQVTRKKEDRS